MAQPQLSSSREKILEVAESLFARRGYAGVGLRELAEAAELSKSSLFHHFEGKAALYCAVLTRVLERVDEAVRPAYSEGDAADQLLALVDLLVDVLAEQPTTSRLLLRALFEDDDLPEEGLAEADEMNAALIKVLGRLQSLIETGIEQGRFRPVSAAHTLQTLIGLTIFHFASGDFGAEVLGKPIFSAASVAERRREVVGFVRHGLILESAPNSKEEEKTP